MRFVWDSEDRSRLMQYLDNFRLSTRDTEEYTDHENLYDFTVAANPRSIK